MAMHLIKEERKIEEVICQKAGQTISESDVIVPDVKPDIKKILEVSGNVCITQKMLHQDKIHLQGTLRMTVLYLPDGGAPGELCSLFVHQDFSHTIDCRGASGEMKLLAEATPESMDYTLLNSRKLNLRCVIGFGVKVVRPLLLTLATDAQGDDIPQLQKERLRLLGSTELCESKMILREQLELPSGKPTIGEILRLTAIPTATELKLMDGKAVVKGQIRICTLYGAEQDRSVQFMEHLLPFTEILDMEGALEGMEGEIDFSIADLYHEIREDSDGEARNLGIELVLSVNVQGHEIFDIDAVTDAYSLGCNLDLTCKTHRMEQLLSNNTAELTHKDHVELPAMLPPLRQVCDIYATPKIDRITMENDQVTVFGTIHSDILYLTEDDALPVSELSRQSEFSHSFSVPGANHNTACDAHVFLEHTSFTLSGNNSLELRFVLGLTVKSLNTGEITLIEEISPSCENPKLYPCIVLYFVEPGDSLWKIAKRYHTTVEELKSMNQLEGDTIYPGQQLKILAKCA